MNGLLEADSTVEIFLSRTRHILDNKELSSLSDADVQIQDEDGNTVTLSYLNRLYSSGDMKIEPGKSYWITAAAQGFNDVEATCVIPESVAMRYIDTSSSFNEWGERQLSFEIAFSDPPGEKNYYMLSLQAKVEMMHFDIVQRIDTLYIDTAKDVVITGIVNDTIKYFIPRYENVWIESEDLAIEQWDYRTNNVIFSDKLFDGKEYTFNGSFYDWFLWGATDTSTLYVKLQSVDEHYFKYIDSREDHYYAKNDPFAVPVVVHNNIENGIGILGGMAASVDSLKLAPMYREPYYW